jgi:iron-sulfur cluster assembly accessory protein
MDKGQVMDTNPSEATISVSPRAAGRIQEILASESEPSVLRVSVAGGGCTGFQYLFDIVRKPEPDDLVIERDGAVVVIDPVSMPFLTGSEIDFVDELIGASFKITNPNATASCGCGTSFTI